MIARLFAVLAGGLILAAVTHVTVIATGGYGTPHSWLTIAVAMGVGFASVFASKAWGMRRHFLAILFVTTIIAGEAYNLLATAERLIVSREDAQAPLREGTKAYARAVKRVEDAKAVVERAPTTSPRLERAMAAKATADTAAVEKSAERGCRENCRQLLQAQADSAAQEITNAQTALATQKEKAEAELSAARADLANFKKPVSATPLADRIGVPAWIIDLVTSALGSVAANGLACCLLIFGAHASHRRAEEPRRPQVQVLTPTSRQLVVPSAPAKPKLVASDTVPAGSVDAWVTDRVQAVRGSAVPFRDAYIDYRTWCEHKDVPSLAPDNFADRLAKLCEGSDVHTRTGKDRVVFLVNVSLPASRLVSHVA